MSIIVKCPGCEKKLKMKEPTPGKKVRCPGCKEPFVPVAVKPATAKKAAPKKRRPAPVEDDYQDDEDYGDDNHGDDYEDEELKPRRAAAAKGKSGKASSSKKKSGSQKKSKAPLFIGVAVLAVSLAGGLVYMLLPDGGDSGVGSSEPISGNDASASSADEAAMMASMDGGADEHGGGGGTGEHGGGGAAPASAAPTSSDSATASGETQAAASGSMTLGMPNMTAPALANSYNKSGPVDLKYLPSQSEAVAKIEVGRLIDGPLGQLLQMPQIAGGIQQFQQRTGMGPNDVDSITFGIGGLSDAISSGRPPRPDKLPFIAVVRTKIPVELAKLQGLSSRAQLVTEGAISFIRIPENPPAGIWLADSNTIVAGPENLVKEVAANPNSSPLANVDNDLFDGKSPIQVLFSPANPDAVFRNPNASPTPQMPIPLPPETMAVARSFQATAKGVFFGIDLTNDIGVNFGVRCSDAASASKMAIDLQAAQAKGKEMQAGQSANPLMAMLPGLADIQKGLEESQKFETNGDIVRMTSSAEGAGQHLPGLASMIPALLGPVMQAGQQAARRVQSGNRLKTIGLGMMNFHSVYDRFPNAASTAPSTGQKLLSWRVHLLPYLGYQDVYEQFALDQPWDSPVNKALIPQMPQIYTSPEVPLEPGKTIYQLPIGPGMAFEGSKGRGLPEFTDGTSNTILIVKAAADRAVFWTQPEDFQVDLSSPKTGLGMNAQGMSQAMLADGSVRIISGATSEAALKSMFTRNAAD